MDGYEKKLYSPTCEGDCKAFGEALAMLWQGFGKVLARFRQIFSEAFGEFSARLQRLRQPEIFSIFVRREPRPINVQVETAETQAAEATVKIEKKINRRKRYKPLFRKIRLVRNSSISYFIDSKIMKKSFLTSLLTVRKMTSITGS